MSEPDYAAAFARYPKLQKLHRRLILARYSHPDHVFAARSPFMVNPMTGDIMVGLMDVELIEKESGEGRYELASELRLMAFCILRGQYDPDEMVEFERWSEYFLRQLNSLSPHIARQEAKRYKREGRPLH